MSGEQRHKLFTRDSKKTRFHACEKEWKCDAVWVQGRGCFEFSQAEQKQIKEGLDYPKMKRNVGCGCSYKSDDCEGDTCRRPGQEDGLVVYVNPAEPISQAKYRTYEGNLLKKMQAALSADKQLGSGKKRKESPADWPTYLVRSSDLI